MYKLCFFVPPKYVEEVKLSLFNKGAGKFKNYDFCSWQTLGQGQFRPLDKSNPFIGNKDEIETIAEYKVEMICPDKLINEIIAELIRVHPYEEPAYEFYKINN
jgi:hypothetical protein